MLPLAKDEWCMCVCTNFDGDTLAIIMWAWNSRRKCNWSHSVCMVPYTDTHSTTLFEREIIHGNTSEITVHTWNCTRKYIRRHDGAVVWKLCMELPSASQCEQNSIHGNLYIRRHKVCVNYTWTCIWHCCVWMNNAQFHVTVRVSVKQYKAIHSASLRCVREFCVAMCMRLVSQCECETIRHCVCVEIHSMPQCARGTKRYILSVIACASIAHQSAFDVIVWVWILHGSACTVCAWTIFTKVYLMYFVHKLHKSVLGISVGVQTLPLH